MRIAIGADHRGTEVAAHLHEVLRQQGHDVVEPSPACNSKAIDYPDQAYRVSILVARGEADRGILICGSGIGMSMAANKVHGVRAALVHDEIGAEVSRRHNDANVLCLSADMLGVRFIDKIVLTWLRCEFEGGRHARRVKKIVAIERGLDPTTVTDATVLPAAKASRELVS